MLSVQHARVLADNAAYAKREAALTKRLSHVMQHDDKLSHARPVMHIPTHGMRVSNLVEAPAAASIPVSIAYPSHDNTLFPSSSHASITSHTITIPVSRTASTPALNTSTHTTHTTPYQLMSTPASLAESIAQSQAQTQAASHTSLHGISAASSHAHLMSSASSHAHFNGMSAAPSQSCWS